MKSKSVCLIRCPNFLLWDEKLQIPIGLLQLTAYLKKFSIKVNICDLAEQLPEKWEDLIPAADIFGISLTTGDVPIGKAVAKLIKGMYPKSLIIAGSAHASALPKELLEESQFDVAVVGEGEQTLLEIALDRDLSIIDGIWYKENGAIRFTAPRQLLKDLDELPLPAWELMDDIFGKNLVENGFEGTCITASRGCCFRCAFCSQSIFNYTYRARSIKSVFLEVKELRDNYGVKQVRLVDELTLLDRDKFIQLCRSFGFLGIKWRTHSRADLICKNKDLLPLAKECGLTELAVGIENPHPEMLKIMNKRITPEEAENSIYAIKEAGIKSKAYFIIGLPGESWETIEYMKSWILRVRPDRCTLSTFVPYPNCAIYLNPEKYKMKLVKEKYDWKDFWILGYENTNHNFIMETEFMTNEELVRAREDLLNFMVDNGYKDPPPAGWKPNLEVINALESN